MRVNFIRSDPATGYFSRDGYGSGFFLGSATLQFKASCRSAIGHSKHGVGTLNNIAEDI